VRLEPGFSLKICIRHRAVQEFSFISTTSETTELEVLSQVELIDVELRQEIARYTFAPIVVWVGTVPVVFTPVLAVHVGLDGTVSVGISAGVTESSTLTAGATFAQAEWTPVWGMSQTFDYRSPELFAGARFLASAGPRLSLLVYGVAGPYTETTTYLELEADLLAVPWWQLFGGIRGDVGVRVEILGRVIASYQANLFHQKWLLAEAGGGFPDSLGEGDMLRVEPMATATPGPDG
jgi:hypothetical protein